MTHAAHLLLFFGVVFGIIVLPGLDMAFVMGTSLVAGARQGLAGVAGIITGGACLVTMTTFGISALLKVVPGAFSALLIIGALYIAWIGVSLLKSGSTFGGDDRGKASSAGIAFRRGALTSLLNPKAYLFLLAIFPQFLHPKYGSIWAQAVVLWLIIAITQIGIYGTVALTAARARNWLQTSPGTLTAASRIIGIVLITVAALTAFEGWSAR